MKGIITPNRNTIAPSELILRNDGSLYHLGIHQDEIAEKVIIVGDPERVPLITDRFDSVESKKHTREFVVHTGTCTGKRITVVSSGIGVDNIDIVINELDAAVNIDLSSRTIRENITSLEIVRIGTSGALHENIPVGSFVASRFAFGLDGVPWNYSVMMENDEEELLNSIRLTHGSIGFANAYAVKSSDELFERIATGMIEGITATSNGFYGPQGRQLRLTVSRPQLMEQYRLFEFNQLRITNFEMECAGIYALASALGHKALTVCAILANRYRKEFHNNSSESVERLIDLVLQRF